MKWSDDRLTGTRIYGKSKIYLLARQLLPLQRAVRAERRAGDAGDRPHEALPDEPHRSTHRAGGRGEINRLVQDEPRVLEFHLERGEVEEQVKRVEGGRAGQARTSSMTSAGRASRSRSSRQP